MGVNRRNFDPKPILRRISNRFSCSIPHLFRSETCRWFDLVGVIDNPVRLRRMCVGNLRFVALSTLLATTDNVLYAAVLT